MKWIQKQEISLNISYLKTIIMSEQPTTVFIKRYPANGELPEDKSKKHDLISDLGLIIYYPVSNTWALHKTNEFVYVDAPECWLEEVPLSSLLPEITVPSEEEARKIYAEYKALQGEDIFTEKGSFVNGAQWAINNIKSLNPSLFASTTKTDKT